MKNKHVGPKKITRSLLESDAPKKKKKKLSAGSKELVALVDGKAVSVLPKATEKAIKSHFGERSDRIMEMIEMGDQDGGLTLLKKALLGATIRVLPMAENILHESGAAKGIYQFATLTSQIRELITDIQADQDRKYIARSIVDNILRPAFMDLAQEIITDHHLARTSMEQLLQPGKSQELNQALSGVAKTLARKMSTKYKEVEEKIFEALKN